MVSSSDFCLAGFESRLGQIFVIGSWMLRMISASLPLFELSYRLAGDILCPAVGYWVFVGYMTCFYLCITMYKDQLALELFHILPSESLLAQE